MDYEGMTYEEAQAELQRRLDKVWRVLRPAWLVAVRMALEWKLSRFLPSETAIWLSEHVPDWLCERIPASWVERWGDEASRSR